MQDFALNGRSFPRPSIHPPHSFPLGRTISPAAALAEEHGPGTRLIDALTKPLRRQLGEPKGVQWCAHGFAKSRQEYSEKNILSTSKHILPGTTLCGHHGIHFAACSSSQQTAHGMAPSFGRPAG